MALTKRVLSRDPEAGTVEYFYYDDVEDKIHIQTEQEADGILASNQDLRNDVDERARFGGDGGTQIRVASVPMTVYSDLVAKGVIGDQKALRHWLNDPDNRVFRTRPGRV